VYGTPARRCGVCLWSTWYGSPRSPNGAAYAPGLNPDEYVWAQSKHYLANATPQDVEELSQDLRRALGRIGRSQQLLKACLCESTLSF
jgi:hypothetical protein